MNFKKLSVSMLAVAMLAGCGTGNTAASNTSNSVDKLTFTFVPSRDADEIISGTEGLDKLIIDQMAERGYDIGEIEINVSTTYEAAGEALSAGTSDVAWLPGGTYVLYDDGCDVILTATRNALSNDSENGADWNGEANATKKIEDQTTYYRALIYATPSAKGKELAAKVNAGNKLTWDELNSANWAVMNVSSSAGYIYPSLYLMNNYDGKSITDLANVTTLDSYATAFQQAAAEQVDVIVCYADGRNDYESIWTLASNEKDATGKQGLGRSDSIWNELNVIGVGDKIYNDTVAISTNPVSGHELIKDDAFKTALQESMIAAAKTEEGKKIFAIYSHTGYEKANDSDYDIARDAQNKVIGAN